MGSPLAGAIAGAAIGTIGTWAAGGDTADIVDAAVEGTVVGALGIGFGELAGSAGLVGVGTLGQWGIAATVHGADPFTEEIGWKKRNRSPCK